MTHTIHDVVDTSVWCAVLDFLWWADVHEGPRRVSRRWRTRCGDDWLRERPGSDVRCLFGPGVDAPRAARHWGCGGGGGDARRGYHARLRVARRGGKAEARELWGEDMYACAVEAVYATADAQTIVVGGRQGLLEVRDAVPATRGDDSDAAAPHPPRAYAQRSRLLDTTGLQSVWCVDYHEERIVAGDASGQCTVYALGAAAAAADSPASEGERQRTRPVCSIPHADAVFVAEWLRGHRRLVTGCWDGALRVFDEDDSSAAVCTLPLHADALWRGGVVSDTGGRVLYATAGWDGAAHVVDLGAQAAVWCEKGGGESIVDMKVCGDAVCTATSPGVVSLWDTRAKGRPVLEMATNGTGRVNLTRTHLYVAGDGVVRYDLRFFGRQRDGGGDGGGGGGLTLRRCRTAVLAVEFPCAREPGQSFYHDLMCVGTYGGRVSLLAN